MIIAVLAEAVQKIIVKAKSRRKMIVYAKNSSVVVKDKRTRKTKPKLKQLEEFGKDGILNSQAKVKESERRIKPQNQKIQLPQDCQKGRDRNLQSLSNLKWLLLTIRMLAFILAG